MSDATERFRAGLEERGIEYKSINRLVTDIQRNGLFIRVYDYGDDPDFQMCVETQCKTTEQAIEVIVATLGPGKCNVDVLNTGDCAGYECSEYIMHCNGCGHEFGHVLYNEDGDVWMSEVPNFCPNCGRRVVDE